MRTKRRVGSMADLEDFMVGGATVRIPYKGIDKKSIKYRKRKTGLGGLQLTLASATTYGKYTRDWQNMVLTYVGYRSSGYQS